MKKLKATVLLARNPEGMIRMRDLMEIDWYITHKDGTLLTQEEYLAMLAESLGFFDIAEKYKVVRA